MTDKNYDPNDFILLPEIRQYGEYQVFEFHGKDARGFDFAVRLAPTQALPLMDEPPGAVDADRVIMYAGGDPARIAELDTEIEVTMNDEKESCTVGKAAMTYIPKGMRHGHRVTGNTDTTAWVLSLTLPPKYLPPRKKEER